jgi:hypothetical protein
MPIPRSIEGDLPEWIGRNFAALSYSVGAIPVHPENGFNAGGELGREEEG